MAFFIGCSGGTFTAAEYNGNISKRGDKQSVIFLGDTQRTSIWERLLLREQNDEARQAVLNKIAGENPAALVILGDLVSDGSDDEEWHRFDEYLRPIRQQDIPVFPVLGNHDYFGDNQHALDNFFRRFSHLRRQSWSSLTFQSVAIILLNTNFDEMTDDEISAQSDWYKKILEEHQQNDSINAIIVTCHHPPFTNSKIVSDSREVHELFVLPFLSTPKAKLFLTGHCHSYEHFRKGGKDFILSGGGGGPRQPVETLASKQKHADLYHGKDVREFHYCKVSIGEHQLNVQMIMVNDSLTLWNIGDEISITY